jgi:hypothetical protein
MDRHKVDAWTAYVDLHAGQLSPLAQELYGS